MENMEVQEFEETYIEYNYELFATMIDLEEAVAAEQADLAGSAKSEKETIKISELSGGEKDLFQLAVLSLGKANFLLLDEPTGHLA